MWQLIAGPVVTIVLAGVLSLSVFGTLPGVTHIQNHGESFDLQGPNGTAHGRYQLALYRRAEGDSTVSMPTIVAVDEEFVAHVGVGWEERVRQIISHANELLGDVGLRLDVTSIQRWQSDDSVDSISAMLNPVEQQIRRVPGEFLLVITCQDTARLDGSSRKSQGEAIVQYYHNNPQHNSTLIAHEIGHIFGARHHDQEVECHGDGCVMDGHGYAHANQWCHHHIQEIQASVGASVAPAAHQAFHGGPA